MNKLIVLAALLGYTLAGATDFWTEGKQTGKGYIYAKSLVDNSWITSDTFSEVDFGFGTFYNGAYNAGATNAVNTRGQQYGVHFYSYGRQSLTVEIMDAYKYIIDVQVEPVYAAPYIQSIAWNTPRPESDNTFGLTLTGSRLINALDYYTYNGENGKIFEQSLLDVIQDGADVVPNWDSAWEYNDEYYHDYEDAKMSGNLMERFMEEKYTDLKTNLFGLHNYYTKTF